MMPRSLETVREFAREHDFQLARLDADLLMELRPVVVVHATPVGGYADHSGQLGPAWASPVRIISGLTINTLWMGLEEILEIGKL